MPLQPTPVYIPAITRFNFWKNLAMRCKEPCFDEANAGGMSVFNAANGVGLPSGVGTGVGNGAALTSGESINLSVCGQA